MKPSEIAQTIKTVANDLGWSYEVRGSVLTITKRFTAGSNDEFCVADSQYYSILSLLPSTSAGSIWGTDGGGIGAVSAINNGVFKMHKSGGSKRVLSALQKL